MKKIALITVFLGAISLVTDATAQGYVTHCSARLGNTVYVIPGGNASFDLCLRLARACTGVRNPIVRHSTNQFMEVPPLMGDNSYAVQVCKLGPNTPEPKTRNTRQTSSATSVQPPPVQPPPDPPRARADFRHPLDLDGDYQISLMEHQQVLNAVNPRQAVPIPADVFISASPPVQGQAQLEAKTLAICHRSAAYKSCQQRCMSAVAQNPATAYIAQCDQFCICTHCADVNPSIARDPIYACSSPSMGKHF